MISFPPLTSNSHLHAKPPTHNNKRRILLLAGGADALIGGGVPAAANTHYLRSKQGFPPRIWVFIRNGISHFCGVVFFSWFSPIDMVPGGCWSSVESPWMSLFVFYTVHRYSKEIPLIMYRGGISVLRWVFLKTHPAAAIHRLLSAKWGFIPPVGRQIELIVDVCKDEQERVQVFWFKGNAKMSK